MKATEVVSQPSVDAVPHTIDTVDSKKLRTTLPVALAQWPGAECYSFADVNGQLNCPGFMTDLNTYSLATDGFGFTYITDPKDPRRTLKLDGVKQKDVFNQFIQTFCVSAFNCVGFPTRVVHFATSKPTTELGVEFGNSSTTFPNNPPFLAGFLVTLNGADLGFYPVGPGVQYFGVIEPTPIGIQSLALSPVYYSAWAATGKTDAIGALVVHRIFKR